MKKTVMALAVISSLLLSVQQGFSETSDNQLVLHYGIVQSAEVVQLDSEAAKDVLFAGAIGVWAANGKEKTQKWLNTLAGAAAGGVLKGCPERVNLGTDYVVNIDSSYTIRLISDQSEIIVGDCVVIEQSENTINIRREPGITCQPQSREVVRNMRDDFEEKANKCVAGKQQLLDAESDWEVDSALRKLQILCND